MKNKKPTITEAEVQQALLKFKQRGGLIKKLPDEVVPTHNLVGSKFGVYEAIQDTSSAAAPAEAN